MTYVPTVDDVDVNRDGIVNSADLNLIAQHFGMNQRDTNYDVRYNPTRSGRTNSTDLWWVEHYFGQRSNWGTTNLLDRVIAQRGKNLLPHDVHLPEPMYSQYSWGQHGTEDTKSRSGGTVNAWLAMHRDYQQMGALAAKLNVGRMRLLVHESGTWKIAYDGLPTWWIKFDYSGGDGHPTDVTPHHELDGSQSFDIVANCGLHMSSYAPGMQIGSVDAVICGIYSRLLNYTTEKVAMCAGADFRNTSGGSIAQSGLGQGRKIMGAWDWSFMASSTMSDAALRASNPPL